MDGPYSTAESSLYALSVTRECKPEGFFKPDVETRQAERRWWRVAGSRPHLGDFLFKIPVESFDVDGGACRHSSTTKKIVYNAPQLSRIGFVGRHLVAPEISWLSVTQLSTGATLGVPRSLGGGGLADSGGGVDARLRHERGGRCSAVRRGVGALDATCNDALHRGTLCQTTGLIMPRNYIQEAQLSPSDRAMRLVSSNLANYHATVQKLLIRQVLTKPMVCSWRFSWRQCVINKPTTVELCRPISPVYRRLAVAKFFKSTM